MLSKLPEHGKDYHPLLSHLRNILLRFPLTFAAIVFAAIVGWASLIGHVNLIEIPFLVMDRIEKNQLDDVATVLLLLIVAMVADNIRASRREKREAQRQTEEREAERHAEQLRVVQVTMRTVQDIVNNCLNQVQLLRLDAEGLVSEESLRLFDKAIEDATAQLRELGNLEVFVERKMATGSGLYVSASSHGK